MTAILLANLSGQTMLFLATVLATGLLMRRIARRSGRRRTSDPLAGFVRGAKGETDSRELPVSANRWQLEMYELARDIQGELDSKMRILEILIDQARHESERLESLMEEARRSGCSPALEKDSLTVGS